MTRPALATRAEIELALADLPGWSLVDERLQCRYRFDDFERAFEFMQRAARHIQELDHHPEWHNLYERVDVWLSTHEPHGITELDFALARAMHAEAAATRR